LSLPGFCRPASGIVDTSLIHSRDARNPASGFKFSRSTFFQTPPERVFA
jgi:hypothetical protein